MRTLSLLLPVGLVLGLAPLSGCINVKPIRVEPIEITMNVNLRVARELDDFFGDLDAESKVMKAGATDAP